MAYPFRPGRSPEEELRVRLDEVFQLRELNTRLGAIDKMAQVQVAKQREQSQLNDRFNQAMRTETARQQGTGIGAKIGGVFGEKGAQIGGAVGGTVAAAFDKLLGGATAVKGSFEAIGGAVAGFIQKASPASMERFQIILDDVTAVIGHTLTPVIEVLGEAARLFGDVLASILPSGEEMRDLLKPVNEFLADLRKALEPLVPIIHDVLVAGFKALGAVLKVVLWPLQQLAKLLRSIFGGEETQPLRSSVGAAARNVSFTSAEQFARNVNIAVGRGTGKGIYSNVLGSIDTNVSAIAGKMGVTSSKGAIPKFFGGDESTGEPGFFGKIKAGWGRLLGKENWDQAALPGRQQAFSELNVQRVRHRGFAERFASGDRSESLVKELREAAEAMKEAARRAGLEQGDTEAEIQRHLDQAKRRAMDGHPGGR